MNLIILQYSVFLPSVQTCFLSRGQRFCPPRMMPDLLSAMVNTNSYPGSFFGLGLVGHPPVATSFPLSRPLSDSFCIILPSAAILEAAGTSAAMWGWTTTITRANGEAAPGVPGWRGGVWKEWSCQVSRLFSASKSDGFSVGWMEELSRANEPRLRTWRSKPHPRERRVKPKR